MRHPNIFKTAIGANILTAGTDFDWFRSFSLSSVAHRTGTDFEIEAVRRIRSRSLDDGGTATEPVRLECVLITLT